MERRVKGGEDGTKSTSGKSKPSLLIPQRTTFNSQLRELLSSNNQREGLNSPHLWKAERMSNMMSNFPSPRSKEVYKDVLIFEERLKQNAER